ncbi:hypothetical protein BC941DRAFT_471228 [Chlamydoabsidia padenii]|nr:hypothetical protein BC941DRAFT_471228 [Chlamydoabsidia padenii]
MLHDTEKDLLTLMIESELRGEGVLSEGDLGIFFVAGHDTTSFALSSGIRVPKPNHQGNSSYHCHCFDRLRINGSVVALITPRRDTADVSLVNVNIYDLHHNPKTFSPDRFKPGGAFCKNTGDFYHQIARQCIDQNFSIAQQRVLLSVLLRHYTWNLPEHLDHSEIPITNNNLVMCTKESVNRIPQIL